MQQRRSYPRFRVLKGAKIVLGTSSVLDCVVRDLTSGGARIKIANAIGLPKEFAITFDGGRTCRPCRVAWNTFGEVGVEFSDRQHAA
jgi:PilZ domain